MHVQAHTPLHSTDAVIAPTPELRQFGVRFAVENRENVTKAGSQNSRNIGETEKKTGKVGAKAKFLREWIQLVTGLCAVLNLTVSLVGYTQIRSAEDLKDQSFSARCAVDVSVWTISLLQVVLIVVYYVVLQKYKENLRMTLRLSMFPEPELWRSGKLMVYCCLEGVFHMILVPPLLRTEWKVYMNQTYSLLSLNDLLYPFILLRNYHSLRLLFWCSRFSKPRNYLYSVLVDNKFTVSFMLKCILKAFALTIVLLVYCVLIVVAGVALFVFEKGTPDRRNSDVFAGVWTMAVSAVSVGYGDVVPTTYIGEILIVLACFFGCFLNTLVFSLSIGHMSLNRAESEMYSTLAILRYRIKHRKEVIVLLQAWWRFMLMRRRGHPHGFIIIHFYTHLRLHRRVLIAAERERDRRFEIQATAFQQSLHRHFRAFTEYLFPLEDAKYMVVDLARTQYQLKEKILDLRRQVLHHSLKAPDSTERLHSPDRLFESPLLVLPNKKTIAAKPDLAKAKIKAHQRLMGRLVREKDSDFIDSQGDADVSVSVTPGDRESAEV